MTSTIWIVLGIWLAVNVAFVAVRLYVTANRAAGPAPAKYPKLVKNEDEDLPDRKIGRG